MKISWPSFYQIYPCKLACACIPAFLLITGMKCSRYIFFLFHYDLPLVMVKSPSHVPLFATPWAVAYQAPPSMGFSRQEAGVGCHFLLQGIFPTQGLNSGLLLCRQMLLPSEPPGKSHDLPLNLFYFFIGVQLLYNIVFLPCNSVNQLYVYIHSLPLEPLSHQPPDVPLEVTTEL